MRGAATARCSLRLKTQKSAGDLSVFDRFAALKSADAEFSQKCMATSEDP